MGSWRLWAVALWALTEPALAGEGAEVDEDAPAPVTRAAPAQEEAESDGLVRSDGMPFVIIGVHRPVDLSERRIVTPPDLYLGPAKGIDHAGEAMTKLSVGDRLLVFRRQDIPPFGTKPSRFTWVDVGEIEITAVRVGKVVVARQRMGKGASDLVIRGVQLGDRAGPVVVRRPPPPPPPVAPRKVPRKKKKARPAQSPPPKRYTRPNPRYTL